MEAVAAGASILPFIQVVKGCYQKLSKAHGAPDHVEQAAKDVQGLIATLERLSTSRALDQDGSEALVSCLLACVDDVERLDGELKKYSAKDGEPTRKKLWKAAKATLSDEKISSISLMVAGHTSAINLQLQTLQSDVVFGMSSQLESISQGLITGRAEQRARLNEQSATLTSISNLFTEFPDGHASVRQSVEALASTFAARDDVLQKSLKKILERVTGPSRHHEQPREAVEVNTAEQENTPPATSATSSQDEPCDKLVGAIAALCDMSPKLQSTADFGDECGVFGRVLAVLSIMMSPKFLDAVTESGMLNSGLCATCFRRCHVRDLEKGVASVYGSLLSVQQVSIDQPKDVRPPEVRKRKRSTWVTEVYDFDACRLTFTSAQTSRHVLEAQSQASTCENGGQASTRQYENDIIQTTTSISLVPKHSMLQHSIRLSSCQRRGPDGIFSSIPRLAFHRTLPASSLVFNLIRGGQLEEFKSLIRKGEAFFTDQDEYGATLLHYAWDQPEICQYLIQSGADVDYVANERGANSSLYEIDQEQYSLTPMAMSVVIENEVSDEELERRLACRKLLLDAGCDPTIESVSYSERNSPVAQVLFCGVPEAIQLMYDFGTYFVDVNEPLEGRSPLFHLCQGGFWSAQSFSILLNRGADIEFRDQHGQTCLHECMRSMNLRGCATLRDGLVYLIQNGADVFAVDNRGSSIADYAYAHRRHNTHYGSKMSDLWDAALIACGYSLSRFRQGRPRRVKFASHYKRWHFEEIWKGWEHLRPEYDETGESSDAHSGRDCWSCSSSSSEDEEDTDVNFTDLDSEAGGVPIAGSQDFESDDDTSIEFGTRQSLDGDDDGNIADNEFDENDEAYES